MYVVEGERAERLGPSLCEGDHQLVPLFVGRRHIDQGSTARVVRPRQMHLAEEDIRVAVGLVSGTIKDCNASVRVVGKLLMCGIGNAWMRFFWLRCFVTSHQNAFLESCSAAAGGDAIAGSATAGAAPEAYSTACVPRDGYLASRLHTEQRKLRRVGALKRAPRKKKRST